MTTLKEMIVGERFGTRVVTGLAPSIVYPSRTVKRYRWVCDCGREGCSQLSDLKKSNSCGCKQYVGTHGDARRGKHSKIYRLWVGVKYRSGLLKRTVTSRNNAYIEKHITMCEEWLDYEVFKAWCLSHGWREGLQIDRKDNARGYCPDNCHFVTPRENVRNRDCTVVMSSGKRIVDYCEEVLHIPSLVDGRENQLYKVVLNCFRTYGEFSKQFSHIVHVRRTYLNMGGEDPRISVTEMKSLIKNGGAK